MAKRKIRDVEGIGPKGAEALARASITNTEQLLEAGGSKSGRGQLAKTTGLREAQILKWVSMCDLFRIKGVATQNAELLKAAGVDTVKELRSRNAENLAARMLEVNKIRNLARQVPSANAIANWIDQAQEMTPKVTY